MKNKKKLSAFSLALMLTGCGGSDEKTSTHTVNRSPVLTVINYQTTFSKTDIIIALNAIDLDGDALTYSARSSDSDVTLNLANTNLTLIPAAGFYGTVDITVTVSDGSLSDSSTFTIKVLQTSIPPIPKFEENQLSTPPTVPSL